MTEKLTEKRTHEMRLNSVPFTAIAEGRKRIEMRLFDEKRSAIQTGDVILFTDVGTGALMRCKVIALHVYPNFEKLYEKHDKTELGYAADERAKPQDMLAYYSREEIERYGVVGIELALI